MKIYKFTDKIGGHFNHSFVETGNGYFLCQCGEKFTHIDNLRFKELVRNKKKNIKEFNLKIRKVDLLRTIDEGDLLKVRFTNGENKICVVDNFLENGPILKDKNGLYYTNSVSEIKYAFYINILDCFLKGCYFKAHNDEYLLKILQYKDGYCLCLCKDGRLCGFDNDRLIKCKFPYHVKNKFLSLLKHKRIYHYFPVK